MITEEAPAGAEIGNVAAEGVGEVLDEEGGAFVDVIPVEESGLGPEASFEDALHGSVGFPLVEDIGLPFACACGPKDATVIFR